MNHANILLVAKHFLYNVQKKNLCFREPFQKSIFYLALHHWIFIPH